MRVGVKKRTENILINGFADDLMNPLLTWFAGSALVRRFTTSSAGHEGVHEGVHVDHSFQSLVYVVGPIMLSRGVIHVIDGGDRGMFNLMFSLIFCYFVSGRGKD